MKIRITLIAFLFVALVSFAADKTGYITGGQLFDSASKQPIPILLKDNGDGTYSLSSSSAGGDTLSTSSTATQVVTSSTSIVLTASTSQFWLVPASTGTTYYKLGSGTASATNAIPLTSGQITFVNSVAASSTISLSGSGTLVIQQTH